MELSVVVALGSVLLILGTHLTFIARWSGKLDEGFKTLENQLKDIREYQLGESYKRQLLSECVARIEGRLAALESEIRHAG